VLTACQAESSASATGSRGPPAPAPPEPHVRLPICQPPSLRLRKLVRENLVGLVLENKVAGIEKVELEVREIALIGMRAVGWKNEVVFLSQTINVGG
jgi:hypothetical protein